MTDFPQPCPQQYFDEDQFQGNYSSAAGASWSATAFIAPQRAQSAPSSDPRPLPGQFRGHAGVQRDNMVRGWHYMSSPPRGFTCVCRLTSSHQRMLLVIIK